MKKTFIIIAIISLVSLLSCGSSNGGNDPYNRKQAPKISQKDIEKIKEKIKKTPLTPVKPDEYGFIRTNYGMIKIKFFPSKAPNTCANFKRLANMGFYDGTSFHRVVPGFVIQGGDILSRDDNRMNDGTGSPGFNIDAEISELVHERGSIAMARRPDDLNSASSQFYICLKRLPSLDSQYTIFAKVVDGMDVVDTIAQVKRDGRDNPIERVEMFKVWVGKEKK